MARRLTVLHMAHVRWYNAEVQYALDLAGEMDRRGHTVAFLGQTGSPGVQKARRAGIETYEERGFNAKGLGAAAVLPAAVRLARLLRRRRFDAVEVHRPEGLVLIAWACRKAGVPVVRVRGDMRPVRTDPLNRFVHSRLLSGVVASNRSVEVELRARLGALPRVVTIHGGVDPNVFTPEGSRCAVRSELGFPEDALLVGILGRLGRVKGHDHFLDAARQTLKAERDVAFVILAKEPSSREAQLQNRVASDPLLRSRVGILGHREDLPEVLRAFDVGVVASVGSEANCRVGLEWMASGVPLLSTRVGALPDFVVDGKTGFLVPPGSPFSMAEKIVYLADHRGEARRLGQGARQRVLDRFTMERCALAHEALLGEVLEHEG